MCECCNTDRVCTLRVFACLLGSLHSVGSCDVQHWEVLAVVSCVLQLIFLAYKRDVEPTEGY